MNVRLMWMGCHGILEEDYTSELTITHEGEKLGIAAEGARLARRAECDRIVSREDFPEHGHGAISSREAELLEDVFIRDDEFLHGGFHLVMADESEASHLRWFKWDFKVDVSIFYSSTFHFH